MWKCTYIETSAKKNVNIESVFQEILTLEQKRQLSFQVEEIKVSCWECSLKIQWEIKTTSFSGQEKRDYLYDFIIWKSRNIFTKIYFTTTTTLLLYYTYILSTHICIYILYIYYFELIYLIFVCVPTSVSHGVPPKKLSFNFSN